ncbi:YqgE/AlgH family protein [Nocardioides panacisoli]|uniref:YqgE/AlgH family protein n=1 Tax=Nocardioides panacisoli TaxID=627624 RepID=UPI001C62C4C4|nr:YqgE/AlgH family protein [Nocardioides panacisoli]QYJ04262.1 YqgE/AlgH family protein [Nocardioides panacisoli]
MSRTPGNPGDPGHAGDADDPLGPEWPEGPAEPVAPAPGVLLLATPALVDPNFADTVVLLLDVNEEGALGVVINRPSALPVSEVLGEWGEVVEEPEVLFQGGPVSTDGAIAVALATHGADSAGFRPVDHDLGVLDLDTPRELVNGSVERLRIFAGYAGWDGGQLESEIAEGSWYVVPGHPEDAFVLDTAGLWRAVMRRQPGGLALHATRPADPDLN